jgi:hypothetical protein
MCYYMEKEREAVRSHVDMAGGLLQINPLTKRYKALGTTRACSGP